MEMGNGILYHKFAISIAYLKRYVDPWNMLREGNLPRTVFRSRIWSKKGVVHTGYTYWNVKDVIVVRTDWAARWLVPK